MPADEWQRAASSPLRLQQLRCFVEVACRGSLTAASAALNISQPALGSHIHQLEARAAVPLFRRHARGLTLTGAGERLLPFAEQALRAVDMADAQLLALGRETLRHYNIGVTPTSVVTLLPEMLGFCALQRPAVRLNLQPGHSEELLRDVSQGKLDAALCYDVGQGPGMQAPDARGNGVKAFALYEEDLFLVGPADRVGRADTIAFDGLASIPLVLDQRFNAIRRRIEDTAAARGIRLDVQQEVEPSDLKRALIRRRDCFTVVPYGLFAEDVRQGQMGARRIVEPSLTRVLYFAAGRTAPAALTAMLRGWLTEMVAHTIAANLLGWRAPPPAGKG